MQFIETFVVPSSALMSSSSLRRLTPSQVKVFMDIEFPEFPPIGLARSFPTIGAFYGAVLEAFQQLAPDLDTARQRAEGITGFKKVCDRVEAYRRQANAHAWSSAIVTAASLAISFSTPACKLFEFKPLRNPMQHDLVTKPFDHVDGWVYPPTGPGLGIEVIEEVVEGFRSEKVLARAK